MTQVCDLVHILKSNGVVPDHVQEATVWVSLDDIQPQRPLMVEWADDHQIISHEFLDEMILCHLYQIGQRYSNWEYLKLWGDDRRRMLLDGIRIWRANHAGTAIAKKDDGDS